MAAAIGRGANPGGEPGASHWRLIAESRGYQRNQFPLPGVSDHQGDGFQVVEDVRASFSVATRGHHESLGIGPFRGPQGLPRLGVGGSGDGAGVHHDDPGLGTGINHPVPGRRELAGHNLAVRLVELASLGDNGHRDLVCPVGALRSGGPRFGLTLGINGVHGIHRSPQYPRVVPRLNAGLPASWRVGQSGTWIP